MVDEVRNILGGHMGDDLFGENYDRGFRNGATDASLAGIARSLDEFKREMRTQIGRLRCGVHAEEIASLKTWVKVIAGVGGATSLMALGVLVKLALS